MIDLSEIVNDPDLLQDFTVERQSGQFGAGGWVAATPVQIPLSGVVIPTSTKDINLLPEGDRVNESMTFYCPAVLYVTRNDATPGTSDQISYGGSKYRLASVRSMGFYGYYKAIGIRMSGD